MKVSRDKNHRRIKQKPPHLSLEASTRAGSANTARPARASVQATAVPVDSLAVEFLSAKDKLQIMTPHMLSPCLRQAWVTSACDFIKGWVGFVLRGWGVFQA